MKEEVILVAFQVEAQDKRQAQELLMDKLPEITGRPDPLVCWWIAEDDRIDGSDNDSAKFVKRTR